MAGKKKPRDKSENAGLLALLRATASHDRNEARRLLTATPTLARQAIAVGATREDPKTYFFENVLHYVYAGDTALHVAAAAHDRRIAEDLVARGAPTGARNRRGAEPLHYAADGAPGAPHWNPDDQAAIIKYLIQAGADPNSPDKSGVAPLHRAVRTRSAAAVRALLAGGADPLLKNKSGSTPLHLAVQNTGRSGSGSCLAQNQQKEIIRLLLQGGASLRAKDAHGKTAAQSASTWIREELREG
jgi:hypothetical protein